MRKRFGSFRFAWKGIWHAFTQEHNFRIHILATILVIAAGFYFDLRMVGWALILFAIGFVLVAELFNSAIELLADVVSPGENKTIGKVKDIAAGAVLVSVIVAVIIGIIVFWHPVRAMIGI